MDINLPTHVDTRDEFIDALDQIYETLKSYDKPFKLGGFGTWTPSTQKSEDRRDMLGGVMISLFTDQGREMCYSVRTKTCPIPDVFELVAEIRTKLREDGHLVSYHGEGECSPLTHVLEVRFPLNKNTWEFGIIADDARAAYLFMTHDCVSMRELTLEE